MREFMIKKFGECLTNDFPEYKIEVYPNPAPAQSWHNEFTVILTHRLLSIIIRITISGSPGGCGVAIMHGIACSHYESKDKDKFLADLKEVFNKTSEFIKCDGIGNIITTLGEMYYKGFNKIPMILNYLGFELISEYHNYRHGKDYMQRMYQYKI